MAVFDLRNGKLFGANVLDIFIILAVAGLVYFSANSPRYFESMKGDVEGITGDYYALLQKGYGLTVNVKGYGSEVSGRVVDAERDRLYVFDGTSVLTVCSDRTECDIVPLVIRAYAVPEKRTVVEVAAGSLGSLASKPSGTFLTFSVYLQDSPSQALALRDELARRVSGSVDVAEVNGALRVVFRDVLPRDVPAIGDVLAQQRFSLSPVYLVSVV